MGIIEDQLITGALNGLQSINRKKRIKDVFLQAGESMTAGLDRNETDEGQQRLKNAFSEENMRLMADTVMDLPIARWNGAIENGIIEFCRANEVASSDASIFSDKYKNIFQNLMSGADRDLFNTIMLTDMHSTIEPKCEVRGETTGFLGEQQRLIESSDSGTGAYDLTFSEDSTTGLTIPVNDGEVEWKLSFNEKDDLREVTALWREERKQYPGWFVPKYDVMEELAIKTNLRIHRSDVGKVNDDILLEHLYEFCWRWMTSMSMVSIAEEEVLRESFFHLADSLSRGDNGEEFLYRCCSIGLCLLTDAIDEADHHRYRLVSSKIKELCQMLSDAQKEAIRQRLTFMEIKWNYTCGDYNGALNLIHSIDLSGMEDDIRLRLIGFLYEFGEWDSAEKYINDFESSVEDRLKSLSEENSEHDTIHIRSLLAAIYQLHRLMLYSADPFSHDKPEVKDIQNKIEELRSYYSLHDIETDTISELSERYYKAVGQKDICFYPNRETTHIVLGSIMGTPGYTLYRAMDKSGIPLHARNVSWLRKSLEYYMLKDIMDCCPRAGVVLSVRCSKDTVKRIYGYGFFAACDQNLIDFAAKFFTGALDNNLSILKNHNKNWDRDAFSTILETGKELLVRVCACCREAYQRDIFRIFTRLYKDGCLGSNGEINKAFEYLFTFTPISVKKDFVEEIIKTEADFTEMRSESLLSFLCRTYQETDILKKAIVDEKIIDDIIETDSMLSEDHARRMELLTELFLLEKLNATQKDEFGRLLWKDIENETQLPKLPNRYRAVYLKLPAPENADVHSLVKQYFLNTDWISEVATKNGLRFFGGQLRFHKELLLYLEITKELGIEAFSDDETNMLIESMLRYYELDGGKIDQSGFFDMKTELTGRFMGIIEVICGLAGGRSIPDEIRHRIIEMCEGLEKSGVKTTYLRLSLQKDNPADMEWENLLEDFDDSNTAVQAGIELNRILCADLFTDAQIKEILPELVPYFVMGPNEVRKQIAIILHNLLYMDRDILSPELMKGIERGLRKARLNDVYSSGDDAEVKSIMLLRESMARLAGSIHKYLNDRNQEPCIEAEEWINSLPSERYNVVANKVIL